MSYEFTNNQERIYEAYGNIQWEILIEITNTGSETLHFGSQNYYLADNDGKILGTGTLSSFPSILHPGEKGCFYDSVELVDISLKTEVTFIPRWNIKKSKKDRINFDLSDIEIRKGRHGATVFGKITNNTGENQTWAIISVIFYAKDGTPIGVWMTNIVEDMPIGTSFGFEVSGIMNRSLYDDVTPDMVDSYIAYAYPLQWQY